jgi:hypothetical protein
LFNQALQSNGYTPILYLGGPGTQISAQKAAFFTCSFGGSPQFLYLNTAMVVVLYLSTSSPVIFTVTCPFNVMYLKNQTVDYI